MKILIWGTGHTTEDLINDGIRGEIIGFVESRPQRELFLDKPVYGPENIPDEYDLLFVASIYSEEILNTINENHIPLDKVCFWVTPWEYSVDTASNFRKCSMILPESRLTRIAGYEKDSNNFVFKDLETYERLNARETFSYSENWKWFIHAEKYGKAGYVGAYFWQDLWAAKLIYKNNPVKHYDIGSRLDGFLAHLLSFRDQVTMIDIRPFETDIPGLDFIQADATNLEGIEDNSIESLSALCSLEHFGLGRYGDPIDPEACFKAFDAIQRKMMPGGKAYIAVPVGKEHLEFNAHRVFAAETIVKEFSDMELLSYDVGWTDRLEYQVDIHKYDNLLVKGGVFGLFYFEKKRQRG